MHELCFKTNLKSIRPLQISMSPIWRRTHNPKIEFLNLTKALSGSDEAVMSIENYWFSRKIWPKSTTKVLETFLNPSTTHFWHTHAAVARTTPSESRDSLIYDFSKFRSFILTNLDNLPIQSCTRLSECRKCEILKNHKIKLSRDSEGVVRTTAAWVCQKWVVYGFKNVSKTFIVELGHILRENQ